MKKVIGTLIAIILIVVVGIVLFMPPNVTIPPPPPPPPPSGSIPISERVKVSESNRENYGTRMSINAIIPFFNDSSSEYTELYNRQEIINQEILDSITPYIDEINMMTEGITTRQENDNVMDTKQYQYNVTYDRYNNDRYVTLVVKQDIRISLTGVPTGGLRSNKWKDTYTVDANTFNRVYLKDLCKFDSYKTVILDEVNRQAKQRNYKLLGGEYGLLELSETQRFYIKDKKLYVYFEPASIAPFLNGELEFEMPFTYDETIGGFRK